MPEVKGRDFPVSSPQLLNTQKVNSFSVCRPHFNHKGYIPAPIFQRQRLKFLKLHVLTNLTPADHSTKAHGAIKNELQSSLEKFLMVEREKQKKIILIFMGQLTNFGFLF